MSRRKILFKSSSSCSKNVNLFHQLHIEMFGYPIRKDLLCSFPHMGAQCAGIASAPSPMYMQPVALRVVLRGPWRHPFGGHSWLACCPTVLAPDRYAECLWKPQGTVAMVHVGQVITSICTKLQNKEHVTEALCRGQIQVLWPPEDPHLPRSGDLRV